MFLISSISTIESIYGVCSATCKMASVSTINIKPPICLKIYTMTSTCDCCMAGLYLGLVLQGLNQ